MGPAPEPVRHDNARVRARPPCGRVTRSAHPDRGSGGRAAGCVEVAARYFPAVWIAKRSALANCFAFVEQRWPWPSLSTP